jgi:hypothetical protein
VTSSAHVQVSIIFAARFATRESFRAILHLRATRRRGLRLKPREQNFERPRAENKKSAVARFGSIARSPAANTSPVVYCSWSVFEKLLADRRRPPAKDFARSPDRRSRRRADLRVRTRKSEDADRPRTVPNLIHAFDRGIVGAHHFFSTRTDTDLFPRGEHSQGGAQQSERYLYGAQRAIKSTLGRVPALFEDMLCPVLLNERANH